MSDELTENGNETIIARFSFPENGRPYQIEAAKSVLKHGEEYEVDHIEVFPWYTDVFLKGISGKFNSVQFDFTKDGEPYDPVRDRANYTWQSKMYGGEANV